VVIKNTKELSFQEIAKEFQETFGFVRADINRLRESNLGLNYTIVLLICCGCEMLAFHKDLKGHEVFALVLPEDDRFRPIGKMMWEALRNGLAHRFRPDTINFGTKKQWRFSILWQGSLPFSARPGPPNWLQLNAAFLAERLISRINEYEQELQSSAAARENFLRKSKRFLKLVDASQHEAWQSFLK
jgi:hypothetical protein